ncbi:MAG TPA: UDP-N-acetylmuramate dehydrogenase [Clostridiaceae bacterium]|jgi:UDP-N-acetylmuramate dehydrogenase|nr:UDP-N-acetylmuramate dehydrogenase [Clostridiaceae bacterium]
MVHFDKTDIARLLAGITGHDKIFPDEPMKNHTSFKIGGPADVLVLPESIEQIAKIVDFCNTQNIPFLVIGNGTNLLVKDKGIRGVVIKLCSNFNRIAVCENKILAQAGALLSKISVVAMENRLSGMEQISGIPGTLGGAVTMNAGAYGLEMKEIIVKTKYLDTEGRILEIDNAAHNFENRTSIFQHNGGIVLESVISLYPGDKNEIREKMKEYKRRRNEKQPVELPSAGSVFRRPPGYYAGKLIEDCGLKGFKIGGAEVSPKHGGFIVNTNNASARDVLELIEYIQNMVYSRFGVELNTEVKIVGED